MKFYGPECYEAHLQKQRGMKSVCERFRKCLECCKVYEVKGKKKHQCYQAKCRVCGKVTDVNHDCFIQPLTEEETEEETEDYEASVTEENSSPPLKPLICFVELECSLNEKKEFEVHRAGWMYEDEDTFYEAGTVRNVARFAEKHSSE